jgi:hypothetical protein
MSVLREVQPRVYALNGGLFANWVPSDQVAVGDYGVIARERFVRDGNLRHWNLDYEVETLPKSKGRLEYSDRAEVSIELSSLIRTPAALASGLTKSSANIKFHGRGAFLYHLSKITTQRLGNPRLFFEELARKWIAGEIKLEEKSVIVNEIRLADKATIVVSEGTEGSLELQGDLSPGGEAILADVKGGLSVKSSYGNLFQWLDTGGTIPLLSLVRPVMGPPPGTPATESNMSALVRRVQALFQSNKWDVRAIQLRNYLPAPEAATLEAMLPNGEVLMLQLQSVSAEEFLTLNHDESEDDSFVSNTIPNVPIGGAKAAGA